MFGKFSRVRSLYKSLNARGHRRVAGTKGYTLPHLRNDGLRYGLFAIFAPPLAVWITFWIFTDLPYYLPDAPIRISHYWDLGSHGVANAAGIAFGCILGWPIMLLLVMPYCARKRRRGALRFRAYLLPAIIVSPVLVFVLYPVLFGWKDALDLAIPTVFACFLTMILVYLGYVIGDPRVSPEMLADASDRGTNPRDPDKP